MSRGQANVNPEDMAGVVLFCTNLANWNNVGVKTPLGQALPWPSTIKNDANAAAYSEYRVASTQNPLLQNAVLITLGTGIGRGIAALAQAGLSIVLPHA